MKKISYQELSNVISLTGPERYAYFVRVVADCEELWTLRTSEGYFLLADSDERQLIPVWPHRRYAEAFADAQLKGAKPAAIALEKWVEAWTSGLKTDNRGVAVFPVPSGKGVVVTPDQLREDLLEECNQYE
jgi:hypothetical protein